MAAVVLRSKANVVAQREEVDAPVKARLIFAVPRRSLATLVPRTAIVSLPTRSLTVLLQESMIAAVLRRRMTAVIPRRRPAPARKPRKVGAQTQLAPTNLTAP